MSAGAVTTLVDRLQAKGYVERRPNPDDRRSSLVAERDGGVEETLRHLGPFIREMREIEARFTEEEREVVLRYLRAVTEATHRHATQGSDPPEGLAIIRESS